MKKTKSVGLVSDKTSVLQNESLHSTDVTAGALTWRSNTKTKSIAITHKKQQPRTTKNLKKSVWQRI